MTAHVVEDEGKGKHLFIVGGSAKCTVTVGISVEVPQEAGN